MASLIGSGAFLAVLMGAKSAGIVQSHLLWTIGNYFSKSPTKAKATVIPLHFIAGVVHAFLYALLWFRFGFENFGTMVAIGLLTGTLHGIAISFTLLPMVERSRQGFNVVGTHVAAHAAFGVALAIALAMMGPSVDLGQNIAMVVSP